MLLRSFTPWQFMEQFKEQVMEPGARAMEPLVSVHTWQADSRGCVDKNERLPRLITEP